MRSQQLPRWLSLGGIGLFISWVGLSLVLAPPYMVATSPYWIDVDPGDRGLAFESTLIPSDELLLRAWWIPAEWPRAELIFVHGAGSNRISEFVGSLDFYRTLNELGVSVVTMDLRNHGKSSITDGRLRMGATEWRDVIAAGKWLDVHQASELPRLVLGASMGGSAAIHAAVKGLSIDGMILLDPQLDVFDSLMTGGEVNTGIPAPFFWVAARAAINRYALPHGPNSPLRLATHLDVPILLLQDLDDPVTRSPFAAELARNNEQVTLKQVPSIEAIDPCLEGKGRWGSHVAAHVCHPDWVQATLASFIGALTQ
jgi:pimeloyl-ACP methyl ester carboxylesterase